MKKFHKTVTPTPPESIQKVDCISGTYVFLNKRYEIQLTPPPFVKFFHKIPLFLKECFPKMAELSFLYEDVCLILIDEVSMLGTKKLAAINYR